MIEGKSVGCVIRCVVRPEYRERGVARMPLRRAVADFRECGCDAVPTLPAEIPDAPQKRYRGTLRMYEEMGFARIERRGPVGVMWLDLKS